jgi:sporulation protein YlmC with PRC-barrel domain
MNEKIENENLTGANHEGANPNWPIKVLTASSIIGDDIVNSKDEKIGTIKDIMIDIRRGIVEYVVIECSGFLGRHEKLFAVPFSELKIKPSKRAFVLLKDDAFLKKAPGFDKDHWPETNSHHYAQVEGYWGDFIGVSTGAGFDY